MNFKSTKPLSDNPGTALIQCVTDMEICENNPNYVIDMDKLHAVIDYDGIFICSICLGGSHLARKVNNIWGLPLPNFSRTENDRILSMDRFRKNYFIEGLHRFFKNDPTVNKSSLIHSFCCNYFIHFEDFPDYHDDPDTFKNLMLLIGHAMEDWFA